MKRLVHTAFGVGSLVALATVAAACTRDGGPEAQPVERPASAEAIVAATAGGAGLRVDLVVGTDDLVVLRSTALYDNASGTAYRISEGAVGEEFDSADPPPLTDFGETWFVDGEVYELAPGDASARPVSGDLADFLFVDRRGDPVNDLVPALEQLLDGWPAASVSDAELVDGRSTHRLRFERADGDVLDIWVDDGNRIVRAVRTSERAAPLELRLDIAVLEEPPTIPDLPPFAGS